MKNKEKIAIYPGSFDPITNGHLDILKRALSIFDKVILLLAHNPNKNGRFTPKERIEMMKEATKDLDNVVVDMSDELSVDYALKHDATHMIRGLRAVSDFEYEFQLSSANRFASKDIDMVFFMANGKYSFITSSAIMELYEGGKDVSELVPPCVIKMLKKR